MHVCIYIYMYTYISPTPPSPLSQKNTGNTQRYICEWPLQIMNWPIRLYKIHDDNGEKKQLS